MRHEVVDRFLRKQGSGRIIGIGDENEPSFARDCTQHSLQVLLIIRAGHFNGARAKRGRDQFVDDECIFRRDYIVPWIEKGVTKKFEHFI